MNMKTRTLCRQIESWARHRNGECYCDECIAREIGESDADAVRRAVVEVSTSARGADFSRYRGTCSGCGNLRLVIAPNRLIWA